LVVRCVRCSGVCWYAPFWWIAVGCLLVVVGGGWFDSFFVFFPCYPFTHTPLVATLVCPLHYPPYGCCSLLPLLYFFSWFALFWVVGLPLALCNSIPLFPGSSPRSCILLPVVVVYRSVGLWFPVFLLVGFCYAFCGSFAAHGCLVAVLIHLWFFVPHFRRTAHFRPAFMPFVPLFLWLLLSDQCSCWSILGYDLPSVRRL